MIDATSQFILADWQSHKLRLAAEACGVSLSIGIALVLAWTTPNPPMLVCYAGWNLASVLLVLSSYSRGSVGLTVLYGAFLLIDTVGLVRTVFHG